MLSSGDCIIEGITLKKYTGADAVVTVPDGIKIIDMYAFSRCQTIDSIVLPDSLEKICCWAFSDSTIREIIIPDSVTEVGENAFTGCENLCSVTLSKGISSVAEGLFSDCIKLPSITIPDNITSIGGNAFNNCISLSNTVLPSSVTSIRAGAFSDCASLKSVDIYGEDVSIYENAFINCTSLERLSFHNDYVWFAEYAFKGCTNLKTIDFPLHYGFSAFGKSHLAAAKNCFDGCRADSVFRYVTDTNNKLECAATWLEGERIKDHDGEQISVWVKRNKTKLLKLIAEKGYSKAFLGLIEEIGDAKFSMDDIEAAIQLAANKEIQAVLLDYKNKKYTDQSIKKKIDKQFDIELSIEKKSVTEGSSILLGQNIWVDKPYPLEWIIEKVSNKECLVISKYWLKKMKFYSGSATKGEFIGWDRSDVRKWLNGEFYLNAFSDEERSRIIKKTIKNKNGPDTEDAIFIPNEKEFQDYIWKDGGHDYYCHYGKITANDDAEILRKTWMARTDCRIELRCNNGSNKAADAGRVFGYVTFYGNSWQDPVEEYYIRPMMWIKR